MDTDFFPGTNRQSALILAIATSHFSRLLISEDERRLAVKVSL
jgi:hypothetical protein